MTRRPRIAIVGAGPAGLTAALAAQRLGLQVAVFDKLHDFGRVTGGMVLHRNGLRVLDALGVRTLCAPILRSTSQLVVEQPPGVRCLSLDYGALPVSSVAATVRRDLLQDYLLSALQWSGVSVSFSHRCIGLSLQHDSAVLSFTNGDQYECDVVIAADGVHSVVCEEAGIQGKVEAHGLAFVHGVSQKHTTNSTVREIRGSDGRRCTLYPLTDGQTAFACSVPVGAWRSINGNQLEYWIESWRRHGDDVYGLLNAVEEWDHVTYSEVHEVRRKLWSKPPIFVVGDAAHAMIPFFDGGANAAMVDALVLVQLLASAIQSGETLTHVTRQYQAVRGPFVERLRQLAHSSAMIPRPATNWLNAVLGRGSRALSSEQMLLSVGYNPLEEPYFDIELGTVRTLH